MERGLIRFFSLYLLVVALFNSVSAANSFITTTQGVAKGVLSVDGKMQGFMNIPFASIPKRFDYSVLAPAWQGELDATKIGNACPQFVKSRLQVLGFNPISTEDENCLNLNIWKPAHGKDLPIYIFFHGGSFVGDAGNLPLYGNFPELASNAILITANYRLGPLGFMAHPALSRNSNSGTSGSYFFSDAITLLKWVNANAYNLGGTPSKITVFGQSAGAGIVINLLASPLAKNLFTSAIVESGPFFHSYGRPQSLKEAEDFGVEFANALGCGSGTDQETLDCLRSKPWQDYKKLWTSLSVDGQVTLNGKSSGVVLDGYMFKTSPNEAFASGNFNRVPVVFGSNQTETPMMLYTNSNLANDLTSNGNRLGVGNIEKLKSLYRPDQYGLDPSKAANYFHTDAEFRCYAYAMAPHLKAAGVPVRTYSFNYGPSYTLGKNLHGAELQMLFGSQSVTGSFLSKDKIVAENLRKVWTSVANGTYKVGDIPWTEFNQANWLFIDQTMSIGKDFRKAQCEFLESEGVYQ